MPPGSFLPRCARDAISFLLLVRAEEPRLLLSSSLAASSRVATPLPVRVRSTLGLSANGNGSPRLPHPRAPAFTPTNRRTRYLVNSRRSDAEGGEEEGRGNKGERKKERQATFVVSAHAPNSPSLFPSDSGFPLPANHPFNPLPSLLPPPSLG